MKPTIAESALNRLLNFADELDALAAVAPAGAKLDAALETPTPELPGDPALVDAVVLEGLGLARP